MSLQAEIISALHVEAQIDPKAEIARRVQFLKEFLQSSGMNGYVLGISGGQDSTLAGRLAQMAINELNEQSTDKQYTFIAVRLPYGTQFDEADAQDALTFIQPSKLITVNIQPAVDASFQAFYEATGERLSDYLKGNTKARERMKVQYDLGAHYRCLVIGTDHAAESLTGFYTKHGDSACDIAPIYGLSKRQGKALLQELDCPKHLYLKVPTADLEDEKPGLPDEVALGVTYEEIDDYLEGKQVAEEVARKLERQYTITHHKRVLPVTVYDSWWK